MATGDTKKIVTLDLLDDVKAYIDFKDTAIESKQIKSGSYTSGKISFYTTESPTGTAAIEVNIPKEYFLDQAKTKFVPDFEWSVEAYPNTTDPDLDGESVLVLAVKGEEGDTDVTYSFISISEAITIYKGGTTDTATVTVTGDTITANVNVKSDDTNAITTTDGLYVPKVSVTASATFSGTVTDNAITGTIITAANDSGLTTTDGLAVSISSEDDNVLEIKDGALYVPAPDEVELEYATEEEIRAMFSTTTG